MSVFATILLLVSAPTAANQIKLDKISVSCGLKSGDVVIDEGKLVRIRPVGTPEFKSIACLLPKLKQSGFITKIGFISEPPAEPKK